MNRYLVFPVKVDVANVSVKSREDAKAGTVVQGENYEEAHKEGGNHVPLFEGEQLAVVLIGKAS